MWKNGKEQGVAYAKVAACGQESQLLIISPWSSFSTIKKSAVIQNEFIDVQFCTSLDFDAFMSLLSDTFPKIHPLKTNIDSLYKRH